VARAVCISWALRISPEVALFVGGYALSGPVADLLAASRRVRSDQRIFGTNAKRVTKFPPPATAPEPSVEMLRRWRRDEYWWSANRHAAAPMVRRRSGSLNSSLDLLHEFIGGLGEGHVNSGCDSITLARATACATMRSPWRGVES